MKRKNRFILSKASCILFVSSSSSSPLKFAGSKDDKSNAMNRFKSYSFVKIKL